MVLTNKRKKKEVFRPPLDRGIKRYVETLRAAGIETYASCEGGSGHPYIEPTIRFYGEIYEGFKALAIALAHGLPVDEIRQFWSIQDQQPVGPDWAMTFSKKAGRPKANGAGGIRTREGQKPYLRVREAR